MSTADTAVAPGGLGLAACTALVVGNMILVAIPIHVAITWRNRALNIAAVERPLR